MLTSTCKGCGRKIVFAIDENAKVQILDMVAPVYLLSEEEMGVFTCERVNKHYVSHFATCPKANEFHKKN